MKWKYYSGGVQFAISLPADPMNPAQLAVMSEELEEAHATFYSSDYSDWWEGIPEDEVSSFIAQVFDGFQYVVPAGRTAEEVSRVLSEQYQTEE